MQKKLKKIDADKWAAEILSGAGIEIVPDDYRVTLSRSAGRSTVKLSDLYGHCFVYKEKRDGS
jgi:hypothetical protein